MSSHQVLAGFHAVVARLRYAPDSIKEFYVEASRRDKRMQALIEQAQAANIRVHPVSIDRLDGLARGTRHQGVVALAQARELARTEERRVGKGSSMPGAFGCRRFN